MKGKTVIKAIAYLLAVLLVVAAVVVVYHYTNGFNEDFKTFYVEHDGKQILSSDTKLDLYWKSRTIPFKSCRTRKKILSSWQTKSP